MAIDFPSERWSYIKEVYDAWWEHELDRPIVPITASGYDAGRPCPEVPYLWRDTAPDLTYSAEEIVDRLEYTLSTKRFFGDAYPIVYMQAFGPGVVAAFLGCDLLGANGDIWFKPKEVLDIRDLHFEFKTDSIWFQRILSICHAAVKRFHGNVLISMTDLGGVLDILASFRTSEKLLLDLYDEPDEVKRCVAEIHDCWFQYYNAINEVLFPDNPGYSDWMGIYSSTPSYVLQSDFSYMISPEMFDEFVREDLVKACRKLDHTIYHLDGVGELPHLDSILKISELNAVQWGPGDGKPPQSEWPEVMKKIRDSGKGMYVYGSEEQVDTTISYLNGSKNMFIAGFHVDNCNELEAKRLMDKYGVR